MRGLPPVPPDVALLQVDVRADGARSSVGFWLYSPFWATALTPDIVAALALLNTYVVTFVNDCSAAAAIVDELRLSTYASTPFTFSEGTAPNHGAWGGMTPNNCATGIYWHAGAVGRGGHAVTKMPAFPDNFTDDHLTVNDTCVTNVRNAANTFLNAIPTAAVGTLSSLALATITRSHAGAPRIASQVLLVDHATISLRIARCSRRLYMTR